MTEMHTELTTIYCDESGNTGPDLLNKADPFFVYAWILLTKEQEDVIASQISDLLKREGLPLSTELRAVKLWQSTRGCRRYDQVLRIAHNAGASVFITYSEKVFQVCTMIVDTYLDPDHNPGVRGHMRDLKYRRLLANVIQNSISEDVLSHFLSASRSDDVNALRNIGATLARQLALHPDERVSHTARVLADGLNDFFRFGQRLEDAPKNVHLISGQHAVFLPAMWFIDSTLNTLSLKARLVRDQDIQFGEVLDFVYKFLSQPPSQLRNIASVEENTSSQSMGLQIADLAAGVTARILSAKYKKHPLKPDQWAIWKSLRGSLLWGDWSYQLTSDHCEARLAPVWKYTDRSWYEHDLIEEKNKNNPPGCSCGQSIPSGRMRDFYLHVLEFHPKCQVIGFPCNICGELIPFGLGGCHQLIKHGIRPPLRGDFYGDMQGDYEVLQKISEQGIEIVVPKRQLTDVSTNKTD